MQKLGWIVVAISFGVAACAHTSIPPAAPIERPSGLDDFALKEAGWRPLDELVEGRQDVIRVATVFALAARPYVEIRRSGDAISIELTDSVGNKLSRRLPASQWQALVAKSNLLDAPISEARSLRHLRGVVRDTGYCHGGAQIETALSGKRRYVRTSVCLGSEARPALEFVDAVNSAALTVFPECGAASTPNDVVLALAYCPTTELRKRR